MEYALFAAGIVLILVLLAVRYNKIERNKYINRLKESYGKPKNTHTTYNHFEVLAELLSLREVNVDYTVWNDLDMNRIFDHLDGSISAIGEEYLYLTLHKIEKSNEKMLFRKKLAKELSDKEYSLKFRILLGEIKKNEFHTVLGSVKKMTEAKLSGIGLHVVSLIAFIAFFAMAFFSPELFVMPCIIIAGINCMVYTSKKSEVAGYDDAVAAIISWLYAINCMAGIDTKDKPELNNLQNEMDKLAGKFDSFNRFSWLLAPKSAVGSMMDTLMDYIKFITHLDLIKFKLSVKILRRYQKQLMILYEMTGELELAIINNGIMLYDTDTCFSDLNESDEISIEAKSICHPLLLEPVPNDCVTTNNMLLTGSNASGKSTYLKTVAVNMLLAQTIGVCFAESFKAPFMNIRTSINISDDIITGDSFYLAEIKRIKSIIETVDEGYPLLICIDEILKGTNTVERIPASSEILRYFAKKHVLIVGATHDIELTGMLKDCYDNYYFTENVKLENIFDYKLRKGVVYTSNAIKLLERYDFPKEIINNSYRIIEEEKCR